MKLERLRSIDHWPSSYKYDSYNKTHRLLRNAPQKSRCQKTSWFRKFSVNEYLTFSLKFLARKINRTISLGQIYIWEVGQSFWDGGSGRRNPGRPIWTGRTCLVRRIFEIGAQVSVPNLPNMSYQWGGGFAARLLVSHLVSQHSSQERADGRAVEEQFGDGICCGHGPVVYTFPFLVAREKGA